MQKTLSAWLSAAALAIAACLGLETAARAQETPLDYLASILGAPPAEAAQAGCQGNCGWISDGCCAEDCCFPQTTARLEYLMWWGRGQNLPPLVTTSPNGTPQAEAGVLGFPNTTTLFGGEGVQQRLRSGARITINRMLDDGDMIGGRFWGLENAQANFFAASTGDPILAIPFFNTQVPGENSQLVAFPGVTTDGSVSVRSYNQLLGADAWFRRTASRDACFQLDWLAGYQFVRMNDSLFMRSVQTDITGAGVPVGTVLAVQDNFRTSSEFHGATVGLVIENQCGCWQFDVLAKMALGNMHETVNVSGSTTVTQPAVAPSTTASGLFAQGTNSGVRSTNRFTFIPELNANLGYRLSDQWSFTTGYSFLYINNVAVSGGQIDRTINPSQNPGPIVGPARPAPLLNSTDYWVQGLSLGMDYRY